MRQTPGASCRQIDVKRAMTLPLGSLTGPVLRASEPELNTSTCSGSHEKGAARSAKNSDHRLPIAFLPRSAFAPEKKIASSERNELKAAKSRAAMLCAKARSVAKTCSCAPSGAPGSAEQPASDRAMTIGDRRGR